MTETKDCTRCKKTFPTEWFEGFKACPECRERNRKSLRRQYEKNREHILERNRLWRVDNTELYLSAQREKYHNNPAMWLELNRQWRKNNPERSRAITRASNQRRRALEHDAMVEEFTQGELRAYWIEQGIDPDACVYCPDGLHEHDDHVIPLSRGGLHERANLLPACAPCNLSKGAKLLEEWRPEWFEQAEDVSA